MTEIERQQILDRHLTTNFLRDLFNNWVAAKKEKRFVDSNGYRKLLEASGVDMKQLIIELLGPLK